MNIHKNARLTPCRREEMALAVIASQLSQTSAARTFGVTAKVVARWVERYGVGGRAGLSVSGRSGPKRQPCGPLIRA